MKSHATKPVCDTTRGSYKHWTTVTLRYGDTDRQGHINNAVYCTFLESGRVDFLYKEDGSIAGPGKTFVIAKLTIDFLAEINFPGTVEIGSKVISVGKSSFRVGQAIFKDGICCSTSESIIVLTDESTRKSTALPDHILETLQALN
jgi:acyl-CoA thioester hydrolase